MRRSLRATLPKDVPCDPLKIHFFGDRTASRRDGTVLTGEDSDVRRHQMAELLLVEPTIVEHLSSTAVVWSESSHENLRSTFGGNTEFTLSRTSQPGRRLFENAFRDPRRIHRNSTWTRTWNRTRRGCHGRKDGSQLDKQTDLRRVRWISCRLVNFAIFSCLSVTSPALFRQTIDGNPY